MLLFFGGGEGCCPYAIKIPKELSCGFIVFFTVGDCLYANMNCNFGLALMQDLYISRRSAILEVIAFMPVDHYPSQASHWNLPWKVYNPDCSYAMKFCCVTTMTSTPTCAQNTKLNNLVSDVHCTLTRRALMIKRYLPLCQNTVF